MAKRDEFTRDWIIENALDAIQDYDDGILTLRGLHYLLVSRGMTNSIRHYKRVIGAMTVARWDGRVAFDFFADNDRAMIGETEYEKTTVKRKVHTAEWAIDHYMSTYKKNKWENQIYYPEVFIEKKALQGVFNKVCERNDVTLGACKGYPSLTFLNDTAERLKEASSLGKTPVILYFGDYDPSGEDIPRSIEANLEKFGVYGFEVRRILLMEDQVIEMGLPPAPAKSTDSRSANWDGLGQVELDAIEPNLLQRYCQDAIDSLFDTELYDELLDQQREEKKEYVARVKQIINSRFNDED